MLAVKTTIIHPATEKHIERYGMQVIHIINETPAIYKDIIEPGLQDSTQFTLQVFTFYMFYLFIQPFIAY